MHAAGPLIAHRGASAHSPENTLAALSAAADMGCGWVEIDAQVTRDGGVVLMHDHSVDRTTDGRGPVAMMELADFLRLRTRSPLTGALLEESPPSLASALALCRELDLGVVLEIKATWGIDADNAARIAAVVPEPEPRRLLVTSFSVSALRAFHAARPNVALGLACLKVPRAPEKIAGELHLSAIHCNADYTDANDIRAVKAAGLDIAIATINQAETAQRFLDAGADGVMTDEPRLLA
jgi:glycerophosphoryl diester phosphodiesterase